MRSSNSKVRVRSRSLSMDRSSSSSSSRPLNTETVPRPIRSMSLDRLGNDQANSRRRSRRSSQSNRSLLLGETASVHSNFSTLSTPTVVKQGDKTIIFLPMSLEEAKQYSAIQKNQQRATHLSPNTAAFYRSLIHGYKIPPIEETQVFGIDLDCCECRVGI